MINGTATRPQRALQVDSTPSPREIETACEEIRSDWTESEKRKRQVIRRIDAKDARFEAHLRFIQILIAGQR